MLITDIDMPPLNALEVPGDALDALWLRGGFQDSFLSADNAQRLNWRKDLLRSYLERDVPMFGSRVATRLIDHHGQPGSPHTDRRR